jgi:hypothetical protein
MRQLCRQRLIQKRRNTVDKKQGSFCFHLPNGASMFRENGFRKRLKERKLSDKEIDFAIDAVKELLEYLKKKKVTLRVAGLGELKEYLSFLIDGGRNSMARLLAIARYCHFVKKNDYYVYFTSILNGKDILPLIGKKLANIAGAETWRRVFDRFELPPLGSPPDDYPRLTKMIVEKLEAELPAATCRDILTGNYHEIPAEAFKDKKERFDKAKSIDNFLKGEHERLVAELTDFMKEGKIWYEQQITSEVVEFVKRSPEIQNGVRRGNKIYVSKIPYAPSDYLKEKDPRLKRYYACHCPLARSAIRDGEPRIPSVFCYCSGGFEKFAFDTVFGQPTEVELLESALKGDQRCRFAITIPDGKMK